MADPAEGHKPKVTGITNKVVLYTTSVSEVLTSFLPSPCTLEVGEVVPEIPTLQIIQ